MREKTVAAASHAALVPENPAVRAARPVLKRLTCVIAERANRLLVDGRTADSVHSNSLSRSMALGA